MIDESTEFGARVARHLREETVVWLTTVTPSGAPLPRPVGFLWDGGENVSMYSQPGARIRNIGRNPKVTLNFRGDANGGDIVVLSGRAEVDESGPSAAENAAWVAKYATEWERAGMTAESFARRFSVPVRIRIGAIHGLGAMLPAGRPRPSQSATLAATRPSSGRPDGLHSDQAASRRSWGPDSAGSSRLTRRGGLRRESEAFRESRILGLPGANAP
jgi:PPOX class probable F420-dependent enzyme